MTCQDAAPRTGQRYEGGLPSGAFRAWQTLLYCSEISRIG
jgi:hypothetical protein